MGSAKLASLHRAERRHDEAVALYRGLLKAEPTLEDVVRELFKCYAEMGDLTSLVREERHLRQALREAYRDPSDPAGDDQYEPQMETAELFARLKAELEQRSSGAGVATTAVGG